MWSLQTITDIAAGGANMAMRIASFSHSSKSHSLARNIVLPFVGGKRRPPSVKPNRAIALQGLLGLQRIGLCCAGRGAAIANWLLWSSNKVAVCDHDIGLGIDLVEECEAMGSAIGDCEALNAAGFI
jgi:hypothetical protein